MYISSEMAYFQVSTFKEKVYCKSLIILANIMETLYSEEGKTFLSLKNAGEVKKELIAEEIHFEVIKIIGLFNAIKIPCFTWDKKGKKEENQNTLNSVLKPCLPLMWNYIDIFDSLNIHDSFLEFNESSFTVENEVSEELLKFIPDGGIEDAAKIVLENGKSIHVWKSNNKIFGVPGAKDTNAKPAIQCDQKNLSNIILRGHS